MVLLILVVIASIPIARSPATIRWKRVDPPRQLSDGVTDNCQNRFTRVNRYNLPIHFDLPKLLIR